MNITQILQVKILLKQGWYTKEEIGETLEVDASRLDNFIELLKQMNKIEFRGNKISWAY